MASGGDRRPLTSTEIHALPAGSIICYGYHICGSQWLLMGPCTPSDESIPSDHELVRPMLMARVEHGRMYGSKIQVTGTDSLGWHIHESL